MWGGGGCILNMSVVVNSSPCFPCEQEGTVGNKNWGHNEHEEEQLWGLSVRGF